MTTYTKTHNFATKRVEYLVHAAKGEMATAITYRTSSKTWSALDYESGMEHVGESRKAAVNAMFAARSIAARAQELSDQWYALEGTLKSGSTAWHALYSGMENADDTVGEGNVIDKSAAYWELAFSGYESLMDELSSDDRELAKTHNLDDLARCNYCGCAVVDPQLLDDGHYCDECLVVVKWDTYNDQDPEGVQTASQVATDAGHMACTNEWYAAFLAAYEV